MPDQPPFESRPNLVEALPSGSATRRFLDRFQLHARQRAEALSVSDPVVFGHLANLLDDPLLPLRVANQSRGRGGEHALGALVSEDLHATPRARESDFLFEVRPQRGGLLETKSSVEGRRPRSVEGNGQYLWEGVYTAPSRSQVLALVSLPVATFVDGSELPRLTVLTTEDLLAEMQIHQIPVREQVHPSVNFASKRKSAPRWGWLGDYTYDMETGYRELLKRMRRN